MLMTPKYKITSFYMGELVDYEKSLFTFSSFIGERANFPYIAFLLQGNGMNIMVDTGPKSEELVRMYHKHLNVKIPEECALDRQLERVGLSTDKIDFIICTHFHWDHCQNNDLFPGKKVYVQKREVEYAISPIELHSYTYEAPSYGMTPIWQSAGNELIVIDGDQQILPGIDVFLTPGHTPGSMSVRVNTEEGICMLMGDTIGVYENWTGKPGQSYIPSTIHVDLREYEESVKKLREIDFDYMLPGHDFGVLQGKKYSKKITSF